MLLRKLVPPDIMHVISFTRLPRFSRAPLKSWEEPGYEATNVASSHRLCNYLHVYHSLNLATGLDIKILIHSVCNEYQPLDEICLAHLPGPPSFLHATLKVGKGSGDEVTMLAHCDQDELHINSMHHNNIITSLS